MALRDKGTCDADAGFLPPERIGKDFHGHPDYLRLTKEELDHHSRKNRDYARGGDPLGNFERVSAIKKLYPRMDWSTPLGTCIDYSLKQLDAALWQLSEHFEATVENFEERAKDVYVYWKIAVILWRRAFKCDEVYHGGSHDSGRD